VPTDDTDGNGRHRYRMNKGGYYLLDLGLSYTYKTFMINVGVKNLLDSFYVTYQRNGKYLSAVGRTYFMELKLSF